MSGQFHPLPLKSLLHLVLSEIRQNRFLGIPGKNFFRPRPGDPFSLTRYGRSLATPVGVAAGPHTQLALNIVAAWLCGARYIELKTIQTLDELEVPKPCIDMQDVGYNCEWSQELKIQESFSEYMKAWIILHILHKELGFTGSVGTLFNMSVGYDLSGILSDKVQWFFDRMLDCSAELARARDEIRPVYPCIDAIEIPSLISDHVTLSTMHGCPPGEIEKIGLYLVRERKMHTTIKLNPTLYGPEAVRRMLRSDPGCTIEIPDLAFEHDLKYGDALHLIESLASASAENGLQFGIKLTNTLEVMNNRGIFDPRETRMYMSGRALHPISINLAAKLQNEMGGCLDISFSGGADCFNIADILACGMRPVTVCTDLLKPGGYGRLYQYIENLRIAFDSRRAGSLDEYIISVAGQDGRVLLPALFNLNRYADSVAADPPYRKKELKEPSVRTCRPLGWFDCIHAPCIDTCPAGQDIPEYLYRTSRCDLNGAFDTIFHTNPFPSVTGMVCDHLCQLKCTRINYDESLNIREIKRFVAENAVPDFPSGGWAGGGGRKAAIIGAGPAGLSCGWYLRQAGYQVDIFEQKDVAGGMVAAAIPSFRLTSRAVVTDIDRILASGIHLHTGQTIDKTKFAKLRNDYDILFLSAGAQRSVKLNIDGSASEGVLDPLEFLYNVRQSRAIRNGSHVIIIGGGNTAMDAARTAFRLVGSEGSVAIVYRRTINEMPADQGEIKAAREEGIKIIELANPVSVLTLNGRVDGLACDRNILSTEMSRGRRIPVPIPGSGFEIPCDIIIPAIGQELAIDFLSKEELKTFPGSYRTRVPGLYTGGDALRGASTAINAIADGRKAAEEIVTGMPPQQDHRSGRTAQPLPGRAHRDEDFQSLMHRRTIREYGKHPAETSPGQRQNFNTVISSMTPEDAVKEASRCLLCDEICNICVTVCPNLANFGYRIDPVRYFLQKAIQKEDGTITVEPDRPFSVGQQYQVLNIRDLCNECGNCTTFCPSSGRPFADKPGICLSEASFTEEPAGFFVRQLPGNPEILYKENDIVTSLRLKKGKFEFETELVKACIDPDDFTLLDVRFLSPEAVEAYFDLAAEMSIILKGAMQTGLTSDK